MIKPNLSIIMVSYNAENTIKRAIDSIMEQTYDNFEVVFIDGQSSDHTCDIIKDAIKRLKERGIGTKFISEPDSGVYDAMNKGAKNASGLWTTYMNADDRYYDDSVLERVMSCVDTSKDIVYGDTVFVKGDEKKIEKAKNIKTIIKHLPFCPQAAFIKTSLQQEYLFDTQYKISADYDFFLRAYLNQKEFQQINDIVAEFYFGGISNRNLKQTYLEDTSVKVKNGLERKNNLIRKLKFFIFKLKLMIGKNNE